MTDFADEHTRKLDDMDGCLVCGRPTKSHVALIAYDDDTGAMVASESVEKADGFGTVCHGCYVDCDGDADLAAARYNDRLEPVLEALGITPEELAREPDRVEQYRYRCEQCDIEMDADTAASHNQNRHTDETVEFERING
jgi:hypothetical protein